MSASIDSGAQRERELYVIACVKAWREAKCSGQRSAFRPEFQVSADGPFVMTHYPLVVWRPMAPDTATNLNRWRPVDHVYVDTVVVVAAAKK